MKLKAIIIQTMFSLSGVLEAATSPLAFVDPPSPETRLVRDFAALRDREVICLTNGTYHITEAMSKRMWLAPSNNQTGEKLVAFALGGRDHVMLDGGGSRFVIHGRVMPRARSYRQ